MSNKSLADNPLFLKDSLGRAGNLIKVKTSSKNKKSFLENLRCDLSEWMKNENFDDYRDKELDLAIVVYTTHYNYKRQDVDNIAKAVLDGLKKRLFKDDNQIIRLLVSKKEQTKIKNSDTSYLCISFRTHNPKKQMRLVQQKYI